MGAASRRQGPSESGRCLSVCTRRLLLPTKAGGAQRAARSCAHHMLPSAPPANKSLVLVNDWSARDLQRWEYVPLGPFNSKNWVGGWCMWICLPFCQKGEQSESFQRRLPASPHPPPLPATPPPLRPPPSRPGSCRRRRWSPSRSRRRRRTHPRFRTCGSRQGRGAPTT